MCIRDRFEVTGRIWRREAGKSRSRGGGLGSRLAPTPAVTYLIPRRSWPHLQNQIERRLGSAPNACESRLPEHLRNLASPACAPSTRLPPSGIAWATHTTVCLLYTSPSPR